LKGYPFFEPKFTIRKTKSLLSPYLFSKKRKHKKKKKNRPNKIRRLKYKHNNLSLSYTNKFSPFYLNEKTATIISMKSKMATRWYPCDYEFTFSSVLPIRYIDPRGYITRHVFAYWNTDFRSILTTTIATVFDRLVRRFKRLRSEQFVFRHWIKLVAIATIYSFVEKDHIINRSIFLLKTSRFPDLKYFLSDCLRRMDSYTRFVSCQALKQADWLSSRSRKTARKSRDELYKFPYFDISKYESLNNVKVDRNFALSFLYRNYIAKNQITIDLDTKYWHLDPNACSDP
jgi:predicted transcriptional regulator